MNKRITNLRAKREAHERGFTLIELLVVIIILGILSAVVVFAVRGAGDKGDSAAASIDVRTLRTAQETYCAQTGNYAEDEDALVQAGLLSEGSSGHDTIGLNDVGGPCQGDSFLVTCDPNDATCGPDGATPDGNFPGAEGGSPQGMWRQTGDLPVASLAVPTADAMATMPNGKVLFWGNKPMRSASPANSPLNQPATAAVVDGVAQSWSPGPIAVYDPASGTWTAAPPVPGPQWNPITWARLTTLRGSATECGNNCGKVLVQAAVGPQFIQGSGRLVSTEFLNNNYFLFDPVAFDANPSGAGVWERLPDPPVHVPPPTPALPTATNFVTGAGAFIRQINCTGTHPGSDCGKVAVFGTTTDANGSATGGGGRQFDGTRFVLALWNPVDESWTRGASPGRRVTDGSHAASSTTISSATAAFTNDDIGKPVNGAGIPTGTNTRITAVAADGLSATIENPTIATASPPAAARAWTIGTEMQSGQNLAMLPDNRLLTWTATGAGGGVSATYDPLATIKKWVPTANHPYMLTPWTCSGSSTLRRYGGATFSKSALNLPDGTVMGVALGHQSACMAPSTNAIFDPLTNQWSIGASSTNCTLCVAGQTVAPLVTQLPEGKALMTVGGSGTSAYWDGATWTAVSSQYKARYLDSSGNPNGAMEQASAVALNTGQVLIAGGTRCTDSAGCNGATATMTGSTGAAAPLADTWIWTPPVS